MNFAKTRSILGSLVFDLLVVSLLGLWINGGAIYHGHLYLKHGADPRRAAIIVLVLGYMIFPALRRRSLVLRSSLKVADWLAFPVLRWGVLALSLFGMTALELKQTEALRVTLYDVGIFHQIVWSLSHGLGFNSTITGAGNFLKDHFSPSLVLLVPFFRLFGESPFFFPVVQAVLLLGGSSAWLFLAARVPGASAEFRQKLAAATLIFILGFDSLWGNLRWGFHENVIGFVALSWAFALFFAERTSSTRLGEGVRNAAVYLLFLIAACSKEILLLDVGIALFIWFGIEGWARRSKLKSREALFPLVLLISTGVCFWLFVRFENMPHPYDKNYFDRYYGYLGHNLKQFSSSLLRAPILVVKNVGALELLKYGLTVLLPWIFLPFLSLRKKSSVWLFTLIPSFASAALATYSPLKRADFHYVLELWPLLGVLTLTVLAHKKSSRWVWAWAILGLIRMDHDPLTDYREFRKEASENREAVQLLSGIPRTAAVVADELAGTWVSSRQYITRWPETYLLPKNCPDYILVKNVTRGTILELGVQSIISRCEGESAKPKMNSDLVIPVPAQKANGWSLYEVESLSAPESSSDSPSGP